MPIVALIVILLLAPAVQAQAVPAAAPPARVLISDFSSNVLSGAELDLLASQLSDAFAGRPEFTVVDAESRRAALRELELSQSASASSGRLRLGALLSASQLVTGSIGKARARTYLLNIQLLYAETGEIEKSLSRNYPSLALLLDDARDVVASLLLPVKSVPPEYTVMTPETQKTFIFFPAAYGYLQNSNAGTMLIRGLGTGLWSTVGRPLGLMVGGGGIYPLALSVAGVGIPAANLQLPLVMEGGAGLSYMGSIGRRLLVQAVAGARFAEIMLTAKSGTTASAVPLFLDIGPSAELSLIYRYSLAGYVKAGVGAVYFPHLFPQYGGPATESGFAIQASIAFGIGRN